jgi:uncharacterized protein YndB with AHSA1/START domain
MSRQILSVAALVALAWWALAEDKPATTKEGRSMDKVIHLQATLPCKPEVAYAAFTDPKQLTTWLTEAAEVEVKVGGKYELFWEPANRGQNSTLGCRVTAVAPNQLLAFEWKSPKQFAGFANVADPLTHVVVTFVPSGEQTVVHLIHSGWRSAAAWEEARVWQERAWRLALEALAKRFAKP